MAAKRSGDEITDLPPKVSKSKTIDPSAYAKQFGPDGTPSVLAALLAFDNSLPTNGYFAQGFEIRISTDHMLLQTYNDDERFTSRFHEFAQCDGTGGEYALWRPAAATTLNDCPVIALGSEGGLAVCAASLTAFLHLLAADVEAMVEGSDGSVSYEQDDDSAEARSEYADRFRAWLKDTYAIETPRAAAEVVAEAEGKFRAQFKAFLKSFGVSQGFDDDDEEDDEEAQDDTGDAAAAHKRSDKAKDDAADEVLSAEEDFGNDGESDDD